MSPEETSSVLSTVERIAETSAPAKMAKKIVGRSACATAGMTCSDSASVGHDALAQHADDQRDDPDRHVQSAGHDRRAPRDVRRSRGDDAAHKLRRDHGAADRDGPLLGDVPERQSRAGGQERDRSDIAQRRRDAAVPGPG